MAEDSFERETSGRYSGGLRATGREVMGEEEGQIEVEGQRFAGILNIYVHHARNIHNICIYHNQDVYAKFSLTHSPDEALSTRIVAGGGKNPIFNEEVQVKIAQPDAVLKCEIWMLSRARNYLEDQLLGFALIPLSAVAGKGKLTQDFALSSTDLLHSPAGTVRLTLLYHGSLPSDGLGASIGDAKLVLSPSSMSSEAVLLDDSTECLERTDYGDIEFPDMEVARENQQMVLEYFKMASSKMRPENYSKSDFMVADQNEFSGVPFLHLGASPIAQDDHNMSLNLTDEKCADPSTVSKDIHVFTCWNPLGAENSSHAGILNSTTTSLSEEQDSYDLGEQKSGLTGESSRSHISSPGKIQASKNSPGTPTSANSDVSGEVQEAVTSKENTVKEVTGSSSETRLTEVNSGTAFTTPLVSINVEPEQGVMHQHIMDMYMKSLQQSTDSLAKMKLPMDTENKESDDATCSRSNQKKLETRKDDGSKVFYGSGAFF